jgi:hypothetical protein
MCRYGFKSYKSHFACFPCRKAFKQPTIEHYFEAQGKGNILRELEFCQPIPDRLHSAERRFGVTLEQLRTTYRDAIRSCPECRQPMADLGLDFKAPKREDVRAWRAIEGLFRSGHVWHTCGCDGPGYIPKSPGALRAYLLDRKAEFERQLGAGDESVPANSRADAANYWSDRVRAIDRELAKLA